MFVGYSHFILLLNCYTSCTVSVTKVSVCFSLFFDEGRADLASMIFSLLKPEVILHVLSLFTFIFWATVCNTVCPIGPLSVLSVCDVRALWPNGWTDQDETCVQVGLSPGHIVLDGDPAPPPPKGAQPPNFPPMFIVAKRLNGSRCHLARW